MNPNLFVLCSHRRRSAHGEKVKVREGGGYVTYADEWCQGGRPATLEDLGGEKVWWCEVHDAQKLPEKAGRYWTCFSVQTYGGDPANCRIVERILIPLPDTESVGSE